MIDLFSHITRSEDVLKKLKTAEIADAVGEANTLLINALAEGKPLLVCGNGGSASDAEHIAGELVGRFVKERRGYNVISLVSNAAVMTAWSNDYDYESIFARQVEAHGTEGAVFLGISTSGNSINVVKAAKKAREMDIKVISMTGAGGGELAQISDVLIAVPDTTTALIQQAHIALYHYICFVVEARLADSEG